uniref:Uncharacterized protein n=1 Tax=Mycena chlorophos TaxID=658473 RepID=A0ABQ0LVP6_MYCCL|nr:predicted protein [Mycena chlorophos]
MSTEVTGPQYISSHSADVILSDIRPIKLKLEGLRSINVLLDEFLFNILNTARSLSTDKLRASLLSILPTSLGKEALLEAEVELRAYWDRTPRAAAGEREDDEATFNLQWAFELLRLKCEAYCTLNESDEDSAAVAKLTERMAQLGGTTPPAPTLVAPASLYLTAILESMCEHILSNVGRVAARDSSRTGATVQDVFVALCEDHSIYPLFKSMRVYQQIEQLTQAPKPRRSKSFSRNERPSLSSPQDAPPPSGRESSNGHRSRSSVDINGTAAPTTSSSSRTSFDKARKKLTRGSTEDAVNGHKRTDSVLSDDAKQTATFNQREDTPDSEDIGLEKEFDNLMRSGSTMKVSLTPDRLKTMEVYKQEKNRRPSPLPIGKSETGESTPAPSSRANGRRPSLRPVDSIVEDEEELPTKSAPTRKNSSAPTSITPATSSRSGPPRKSSRSNLTSSQHSSEASPPMPAPTTQRRPTGGSGMPRGFDADPGFPVKTRRVQKNRESLDLDDVMAGSDDEDDMNVPSSPPPRTPAKSTSTPSSSVRSPSTPHAVSKSTRELMDFLNQGPPNDPGPPPMSTSVGRTHKLSTAGQDMVDFLNQGPPDYIGVTSSNGVSTIENGNGNGKKGGGSGRLQRMLSKMSMGERTRERSQPSEDFGRRGAPPTTPIRTTTPGMGGVGLSSQTSYGNLANRPVPPRPPPVQPISPLSSPSDDDYGSAINSGNAAARARKQSAPATPKRAVWDQQQNGNVNGHDARARRPSAAAATTAQLKPTPPAPVQTHNHNHIQQQQIASPPSPAPRQPLPAPPVAPAPAQQPAPALAVAEDQARDMRRMLAAATNVDECRLIFEMFLTKAGVKVDSAAAADVPYPSPSASDSQHQHQQTRDDAAAHSSLMELALVELFLGGEWGEQAQAIREVPVVDGDTHQKVKVQTEGLQPPRKPLRSKRREGSSSPLPVTPTTPAAEVQVGA